MEQLIRNSIANVAQIVPLKLLMKGRNLPLFLPFYHVVSNVDLDYINSYNVRNQLTFEKELDYLLKNFEPVSLNELLNKPEQRKMHLSFDDGLKECYSVIAPVLMRKGIPATFFINPDFVDNKSIFHRFKRSILESKGVLEKGVKKYYIHETNELDVLAEKHKVDFSAYSPYMSLQQIKQLQTDGFLIGAHSMNHPEMWLLSEEEQFIEIKNSMNWLVENIQPKLKVFAFPFTDDKVALSVFEKLKREHITDFTFGTAGLKYDIAPNHYQRIPIERTSEWTIEKSIRFEYFYYFIRSFLNKNIVKR